MHRNLVILHTLHKFHMLHTEKYLNNKINVVIKI